jgi:hypothetical protein
MEIPSPDDAIATVRCPWYVSIVSIGACKILSLVPTLSLADWFGLALLLLLGFALALLVFVFRQLKTLVTFSNAQTPGIA